MSPGKKEPPSTILTEVQVSAIKAFCDRWKVAELAVFGSALRDDFGPESDVDVLVTWDEGAGACLTGWTCRMSLKAFLDEKLIWSQNLVSAIRFEGKKYYQVVRSFMHPTLRDGAHLWDMLDAARTVQVFVASKTPGDYMNDPMLQAAVER